MIKTQQRGVLKRAQILRSAGELFAMHGYEGTTLALVSSASGAAIGSIVHLIGHKPALAAAVHEGVISDLTAVVEAALRDRGYDVPSAVHALMTAYFGWAAANPHHQRILAVLTEHEAAYGPNEAKGLQARIEPLLLNWATPLMSATKMMRFTATQLFALIMAPAMASAAAMTDVVAERTDSSGGWPLVLASIILNAITLPAGKPVPAANRKSDSKGGQKPPPFSEGLFR